MRYLDIIRDSLSEARRNPDQNPKSTPLEELKKYAGREDIFVSFTADVGELSHTKGNVGEYNHDSGVRGNSNWRGSKIGINPSSKYDTPIGIYTYPVDHVIAKKGMVEFAESSPYIQVLQAQGNILYLNKVTDEDVKELETISRTYVHDPLVDTPGGKFWNVLHRWATGIKQSREPEEPNEPDRNDFIDEYDTEEEADAAYDAAYWDYQGDIRDYNETVKKEGVLGRITASLLRKLGYDGVVDYDWKAGEGDGIIHNNEPSQAFFLSMKPLKLLETIHNVRRRDNHRTKFDVWMGEEDRFKKALQAGKISDDELIEFMMLKANRYRSFKISWNDISPTAQKRIMDNILDFNENATVLAIAPLSAADQIALIEKDPRVINVFENIQPEVYEWLVENPRMFSKSDFSLTRMPAKYANELIKKDPSLIYQAGTNPTLIPPLVMKAIIDTDFQHFASKYMGSMYFIGCDEKILKYAIRAYKKNVPRGYDWYVEKMPDQGFSEDIVRYAFSLLPKKSKEYLLQTHKYFARLFE